MQEHNDQCRELVGKDYALITVRRYESCKRYLAELIRLKYYKEDLPLSEVNGELVRAFEFYLKTEKECQQNTVIRYMKCLKKITNLALANEWITKDPFIGIKFHEKEVIREFLTLDELHRIYNKEFSLDRITVVRDVFIFASFTGLAFSDVQQLSAEHIVQDNNGNYWIRKPRQKTKNMCNIPLLDIPMQILEKYKSHPTCQKKNVLLPVPCNQKMNSYLKEIADLCGISKSLTTHVARHSYATSVCLANGVSIENVAKMLGHSNIKMTQHYARVLDSSILKDMMNVKVSYQKSLIMNRGIITINETGIVTMPKAPVWMTKFEIADLFGVFSCDIRKAIWAIYKNKELSETDTKKYIKQPDGISYDVYSLEMIIAIAFKICSKETLLFRRFIINEICATKRGNSIILFFSCGKGGNLWYN